MTLHRKVTVYLQCLSARLPVHLNKLFYTRARDNTASRRSDRLQSWCVFTSAPEIAFITQHFPITLRC